jgi:hypothetical protein
MMLFIKWFSLVYVSKKHRHGFVKYFGEFGSTFAVASIKEATLPSCGQTLSGQKVQVAVRSANP